MVWAGTPFARQIEFSTGSPVGAVSYSVLAHDGTEIRNVSVMPTTGSVSLLLVVDAADNTCALPLFENRTLTWTYMTADRVISDRVAYRVDKLLPLAASTEGVRNKLGLGDHEVPNQDIDLVAAYAELDELLPVGTIATAAAAGDRTTILATNALEALAAFALLPTLQLRAAQSESSGTREYTRYAAVDWFRIEANLLGHIARCRAALDPTVDGDGQTITVFTTAPRSPDAITGEEA